jgi:HK97 family phage prohead protease
VERKSLAIELKADKPGDFSAVFSTFNVVDLDGDVTLPGAFEDGTVTRVLPAHNWSSYMVGNGTIRADADKAMIDGRFFLNTSEGKNWYESIKADKDSGANLQEYSYGFDVVDASFGQFDNRNVRFLRKLKVHEVSPVTLGAGINTGTVAVKNQQPPTDDEIDLSFTEHVDLIVNEVARFATRVQERGEVLAKEGRTFSAANVSKLGTIADEIEQVSSRLRELLTATEPKAVTPPDEYADLRAIAADLSRLTTYYALGTPA